MTTGTRDCVISYATRPICGRVCMAWFVPIIYHQVIFPYFRKGDYVMPRKKFIVFLTLQDPYISSKMKSCVQTGVHTLPKEWCKWIASVDIWYRVSFQPPWKQCSNNRTYGTSCVWSFCLVSDECLQHAYHYSLHFPPSCLHIHNHVHTYPYTVFTVSPDNATVALLLWCEKWTRLSWLGDNCCVHM